MDKLQKRYGLLTAICMVVGIVIGSGVFFKAQTILQKTGGNMPSRYTCLDHRRRYNAHLPARLLGNGAESSKKVNGIVDYAEACVGSKYAYYVGWFLTIIYYPCLTSVLSWLSARYTLVFITSIAPDFPLLGLGAAAGAETVLGPECMSLAMFYMCCVYAVNALSPKLAGKLQVSATIIKLIPLFLMAVVGIVVGLANGTLANNFNTLADVGTTSTNPLFASVCATAFAYEGWIIATSINAELKDAKKNLPRALVIGAIIIIATYIFYYVGVAGGATNQELIDSGATVAFINVFGNVLGNILNLFIAISCIGTMNGLMLGCVRGLYSIAVRGRGPAPHVFSQIDKETNMPHNSAIVGLLLCGFWGLYFFLANLAGTWSGPFVFDSSELPIITIYMLYLPIFVMWIKKATDETAMRRYVLPLLAICGSLFMIYASIMGHGIACFWYLIVFAAVMAVGFAFSKEKPIN